MATSNGGICFLCNEKVDHRLIVKHLNKCLENSLNDPSSKEKLFLIKVFAGKSFWLYLEINGSSTLEKLDSFLRSTWLECCGHMSQFNISGESYPSDGEMKKKIGQIIDVGLEFDYEYDFGSTTNLEGKVISTRPGKLLKEIRLLAQNNLPDELKCSSCQKYPEFICSACYDFLCKKCQKKHASCGGAECMLPVVNSPRMGVCGYTGDV